MTIAGPIAAISPLLLGAGVMDTLPWYFVTGVALAATAALLWQWRWFRELLDAEAENHVQAIAREQAAAAKAVREKEEAQKAGKTQSELLNLLNREVRAHLDGIIGSANLILESSLQPGQRTQLVTLRATGESLLYVLGDVQAICNLESGPLKLGRAPLDLRTEIAQVMEVLAPRAALKGVEMVLIIGPDVPRCLLGDASLMRQFFFNLTASALRLTQRGNVVLQIERTAAPSSAGAQGLPWLRFGVNDSWHETMPPFSFEAAAAVPEPVSGTTDLATSMELAVTKRLVEIFGGQFGNEVRRGRGPEFWFDLPMEISTEIPPEAQVDLKPLAGSFIVLLEDVTAARVAADALFKEIGLAHEIAENALDAVECLKTAQERYAGNTFLFVDESIPALEIGELSNALRTDAALKGVKVVLMSLRPEKVQPDPGKLIISAIIQKPVLTAIDIVQAVDSARQTAVLTPSTTPTLSRSPFPGLLEGSGVRVLLVEDNEVSRDVSSSMLKRLGCVVDVAVDGFEAVAIIKQKPIDLVLMDCFMPRMDGYEATKEIKKMLGAKSPPIVALTAENTPDNRVRAEESGMVDFVIKPVSKSDIRRVLEQWVPKRGSRAPVPGTSGA